MGNLACRSEQLQARRNEFDVERAVYPTVLVLGSRARWFESVPKRRNAKDRCPAENQGTQGQRASSYSLSQ